MNLTALTKIILFIACFVFARPVLSQQRNQNLIKTGFNLAQQQYHHMLENSPDLSMYPRTTAKDGSLRYVNIWDWTGGFWPGDLWYVYEYTKDTVWKKQSIKWTESLEKNKFNTSNHDLGFMMYCSYGNAYRLTGNENYKDVLIQSAKSLCKRYNPKIGSIESWNSRLSWDGKTMWHYPVIIDNMMNLELLFFASRVTGDRTYRNIAIKHAENTMRDHIRPDYSTYHVVNYDTLSGKVLNRQTCQGYSDNSTWARGQAWAIYGFTMVYRETKDPKFLKTAIHLADFYLKNKNFPEDKIPYWDFNVNENGFHPDWKYDPSAYKVVPRDASAAAIVSSALLELSKYAGKKGEGYKLNAVQMLNSLSSSVYMAKPGTNNDFLIKHCTGSFPHGEEIDVPLVYADYYYLEALLRLKDN
ncbi:glucuronyl hydrolase [Pedobacter sp. HMWF019]|uniref:glycoside hydrolase family 88 protein n=1 Tax=Pedobacter sp. HMWF019 TaxID=2056856 RepID=UPI000D3A0EAA|nr:glycoside hydrolase family 88 protein [Pedobacter sp. HMWF019]PTS98975.1 glucuronyl hydrolase [Pedobacter sp. HMWF019]